MIAPFIPAVTKIMRNNAFVIGKCVLRLKKGYAMLGNISSIFVLIPFKFLHIF